MGGGGAIVYGILRGNAKNVLYFNKKIICKKKNGDRLADRRTDGRIRTIIFSCYFLS